MKYIATVSIATSQVAVVSLMLLSREHVITSYILTNSKSAEEFAKRLRALPRHVRDEHEWEEVKKEGAEPTREHCDFHPLKVCSYGNCADKENFECEGRDYSTWYRLTCPFHSLIYEIE